MLPLAKQLLKAAGLLFDEADQTWTLLGQLRPVVTVECDGGEVMDAVLEVHSVLTENGCTYANFAINGRYVSIVGLTEAQVAAAV